MNTPTPWKVKKYSHRTPDIINSNGNIICAIHVTEGYKENAELIVRAVNYHDRLVDMVEQLRADLKAARSALYIVGRLQEAQINSKSIQYSEQLLTEIKESNGK